MKKFQFIIGVDVSKNTLDLFFGQTQKHLKISNDVAGFKVFSKFCKEHKIQLAETLIVLEFTGGYEFRFLQFLESKDLKYLRLPGLQIKKSMGIVRGKNDKVDAYRIAEYGAEKINKLSPSNPLNINILKLKELLHFRKRLVRENAGYKATISNRKHMFEYSDKEFILKTLLLKIDFNESQIAACGAEIDALTQANPDIEQNYKLLTSIKGIGPINALMTIAFTENFVAFNNPRSYAVYAGVVPFDNASGTSLNGRKRVSHIANKNIKQELNQAAKSAIMWDKELKNYAERKLENKHYCVVLNNVKFKLILRMFAVVKRGEKYVDNYQKTA